VCELLEGGRQTGVDRSRKMIEAATHRNAVHIQVGRAEFICADFENLDLGPRRFDKIFAIRVGLFWREPARARVIVERWLALAVSGSLSSTSHRSVKSASFVLQSALVRREFFGRRSSHRPVTPIQTDGARFLACPQSMVCRSSSNVYFHSGTTVTGITTGVLRAAVLSSILFD